MRRTNPIVSFALIGMACGFAAWWLWGYMVGMSNDYVMARKAEPLIIPRMWQWPLIGAVIGSIVGGIVDQSRRDP